MTLSSPYYLQRCFQRFLPFYVMKMEQRGLAEDVIPFQSRQPQPSRQVSPSPGGQIKTKPQLSPKGAESLLSPY